MTLLPIEVLRLLCRLESTDGFIICSLMIVNRKAVYRVLKQKRWFVHQRVTNPTSSWTGLGQSGQSQ